MKKYKVLRRAAEKNYYSSTTKKEPFNHYFRRIKTWFNGLNWLEKTKLVKNKSDMV